MKDRKKKSELHSSRLVRRRRPQRKRDGFVFCHLPAVEQRGVIHSKRVWDIRNCMIFVGVTERMKLDTTEYQFQLTAATFISSRLGCFIGNIAMVEYDRIFNF